MTLMPDPTPEDRAALVEVVKTLVSAFSTIGGATIGGPLGAGVGAGVAQAVTSALDSLGSRWREKGVTDAAAAFSHALGASEMSPDEMVRALVGDPALMLLAVTALQIASTTAMQAKIRLMGKVISNAATDQALVEEGLLIARAVGLLESPHFRVLALLNDPPRFDGDLEGRTTVRWTPASLASRLGWPSTSVTAVHMTLQSASCAILTSANVGGAGATYRDLMKVRQPVALQEMTCEITNFGSHLLSELAPSGELADP